MIRLVARVVVGLVANAVALLVATLVLDDVTISAGGFILAVVVFTVTGVLAEPLLRQMAMKNAQVLLGSSALISTLVGLAVTELVLDGRQIRGPVTWILATVLVWAVALVARLLLPLVIFKKALAEARSS